VSEPSANEPRLLTATAVRDLARRYGIRPSRALGQHFVVDPNTIRRVVRLAGVDSGDRVLEVGAGLGTLTLGLAGTGADVTAVEIDRAVLPALEEVVGGLSNVRVVAADAMRLDWASLVDGDAGDPWRMVSNLPYSIATPLLATMLEEVPEIGDFLVMVQREAGERLVAGPGSKAYGSVSVLVTLHAEASLLGAVPRTVFWPQPGVDSVLVRITRRPAPVAVEGNALMRVVRASFSHRRKTLRNALSTALGLGMADTEQALRAAGVDPGARAEALSIEEFARIAQVLG
jgi:16S rRNA (adenine1518-N6/adenine1519-N6)-dimethyltransferase